MHNLPPSAPEIEQALLGSILIDPNSIVRVYPNLKPESFYDSKNKIIYEAMVKLYEEDEPIDIMTVYEEVKRKNLADKINGSVYLGQLCNNIGSSALIEKYSQIILEKQMLRSLIESSNKTIKEAYENIETAEDILRNAENRIFEIASTNEIKKEIHITQSLNSLMSDLEEIKSGKEIGLIKTGIIDLDNLIGGLKTSELTVLGARPSMGKTSLAIRIIRNISERKPVLFFSVEMSHKSVTTKLLSLETGLSYFDISTARFNHNEQKTLSNGALKINNLNLFIDDTASISLSEIKSKAKRLKIKSDISLIIVDYLQLVKAKADTREREIALISSELKSLAKELDIPVLCLSQLNRSLEQRADKRPTLSDLRESGAIEQDADVVLLLYRDEYYGIEVDKDGNSTKGIAELIVAKNRNGATGKIKLYFDQRTTDFKPYIEQKQIETYYNDII